MYCKKQMEELKRSFDRTRRILLKKTDKKNEKNLEQLHSDNLKSCKEIPVLTPQMTEARNVITKAYEQFAIDINDLQEQLQQHIVAREQSDRELKDLREQLQQHNVAR